MGALSRREGLADFPAGLWSAGRGRAWRLGALLVKPGRESGVGDQEAVLEALPGVWEGTGTGDHSDFRRAGGSREAGGC